MMETFERLESKVRGYCRSFPTVFESASNEMLIDENGTEYIDFFAGAGVMNYGHNPESLRRHLLDYVSSGRIIHGLDMATTAKRDLLMALEKIILRPRGFHYKAMFPGPTGTNAVEAALKLARKVTGRQNVISFTNGFHGMTLGALALTGNAGKRAGAGVPLNHVTHMPFCDYFDTDFDTLASLEKHLTDSSSGIDMPAAIVVETVQAEGGVNVASKSWMQGLAKLARRHGILLIVDDIQVGCGRTGPFFSFEPFGIQPDMICLSKSLSGYGLPLSMVLLKPELDHWQPGDHNGTFRGNNMAFVTAAAALREYWQDDRLTESVKRKATLMRDFLLDLAEKYDGQVTGRGLVQGISFEDPQWAGQISRTAFENGMIIETCGAEDQVVKCLPPLTIRTEKLEAGLDILRHSVEATAQAMVGAKA